ncbi:MAG: alpha-glucan family phosphorylase [Bacillota bacterium]
MSNNPESKQIKKAKVAYFCMEYGLDENFRIYSGGLGVLAGDTMKAAKDIAAPVTGIGIMWHKGYTKQLIDDYGRPYDNFPPEGQNYEHVSDTGVEVNVFVENELITCKVWKTDKFGNNPIYLLDANLEKNGKYKWITERLYMGSSEERIAQEIVLGIGGVRALRKLGIDVDIYHFNEGHAALAGTELIKEEMEKGYTFHQAWNKLRSDIVFTTHTPVEEGNEAHPIENLEKMGAFNDLSREEMEEIGGNPFNMTVAGLRLASRANGVARLHGITARDMWKDVADKAPIISITNGVHLPSWVDERMFDSLFKKEKIAKLHRENKNNLIEFIKAENGQTFREDRLLIGFARRAASYKRPDMIFWDIDRIKPLLEEQKIQLVFSGKAHPEDNVGKDIIEHIVEISRKYPQSVTYLEDYNMKIGRLMTRGADVWLNNPRRPLEASGTSGMKAAMNGVLNFSTLDGWWAECCQHGINGWQFGDAYEGEGQDDHDLFAMYHVLLNEVVPTYYDDQKKWLMMMQYSIKMTHDRFSAKRMLSEYYDMLYQI